MAEHLNKILLLGLLAWCCGACAQALVDPTRPPTGYARNPDGEVFTGPVLQSVLISSSRRVAIISGKTVKVGDKFGEAQVVSIADGEVILRTGKDKQVLKLYPSLYKPGADSHAEASPDSPTKGK